MGGSERVMIGQIEKPAVGLTDAWITGRIGGSVGNCDCVGPDCPGTPCGPDPRAPARPGPPGVGEGGVGRQIKVCLDESRTGMSAGDHLHLQPPHHHLQALLHGLTMDDMALAWYDTSLTWH